MIMTHAMSNIIKTGPGDWRSPVSSASKKN